MEPQAALMRDYLQWRRHPVAGRTDVTTWFESAMNLAPTLVSDILNDEEAHPDQRRLAFLHLIKPTKPLDVSAPKALESPKITVAELIRVLTRMPATLALSMLEMVVKHRINTARARRVVLGWARIEADFPTLAAQNRGRVRRLLRHTLGERAYGLMEKGLKENTNAPHPEPWALSAKTWLKTVLGPATAGGSGSVAAGLSLSPTPLKESLTFLADPRAVQPFRLEILARSRRARGDLSEAIGFPWDTLTGLRGTYAPKTALQKLRELAAKSSGNTRVQGDGPLTEWWKAHLAEAVRPAPTETSGYSDPKADAAYRAHLQNLVRDWPAVPLRAGLVVDLSGSMLGTGERKYHCAALTLALTTVFQERFAEVFVQTAGGTLPQDKGGGWSPDRCLPDGCTDLALAICKVAECEPDVILVISDGYETIRPGDANQLAEGLLRLGARARFFQIVPKYVAAEDLSLRHIGANFTLLPVLCEREAAEVLAHAYAAALQPLGEHPSRGNLAFSVDSPTMLLHSLIFGR